MEANSKPPVWPISTALRGTEREFIDTRPVKLGWIFGVGQETARSMLNFKTNIDVMRPRLLLTKISGKLLFKATVLIHDNSILKFML